MRTILIALTAFIAFSCASTYKPIAPNSSYFQNAENINGVEFSYRLGVLREKGNKKYAKREDRKAIRLASVKLVNNTSKPVTVGKDLRFYTGNSELMLLEPTTLHRELKQGVPIYVLYLLLTPMQFYHGDDSTPIGLVVGPGLAIGNMVGAGSANQNFLKELVKFNVLDKTIQPGETVYGIIGIRDTGYSPITIKSTANL